MCIHITKCDILTMVKITLVVFWFITSHTLLCDNHPDRLWDPHSLRYDGYQNSFLGLRRPGREVDHAHTPSSEVKEWIYISTPLYMILWRGHLQLYLYFYVTHILQYNQKMTTVYYPAKMVMVITYANDILHCPREMTGPIFSLPYTWRKFL
jgi:hypothetical protein